MFSVDVCVFSVNISKLNLAARGQIACVVVDWSPRINDLSREEDIITLITRNFSAIYDFFESYLHFLEKTEWRGKRR